MRITETRVLLETPFMQFLEIDYEIVPGESKKWYGVTRANAKAAVVIAPVTDKGELIIIRQPRPMIGGQMLELPAGLMDVEGEDVLECAARELLEETGYEAREYRLLIGGSRGLTVSSGLSDERLFLVLATGSRKITEPLENEGTEPILLPLRKAYDWLTQAVEEGNDVDYKMFGVIRLLEREVSNGQYPTAPEVTD